MAEAASIELAMVYELLGFVEEMCRKEQALRRQIQRWLPTLHRCARSRKWPSSLPSCIKGWLKDSPLPLFKLALWLGKSISRPSIGGPKQRESFTQSSARTLLAWHDSNFAVPLTNNDHSISVACIADTHNAQPRLPEGDILLHAGDLSQYGTFDEIQKQLDWLNSQPHKCKIAIAGNHDLLLDKDFVKAHPDRELEKPGKCCEDLRWGNVIYLQNSFVELKIRSRKIKIFGSPLTPQFGNFAFQHNPKLDVWNRVVPEDTDILLTHGPPIGHLDNNGHGCRWLLKEIWRVKPRLVTFGHIHAGRGQRRLLFNEIQACYENITQNERPWSNLVNMAWYVPRHAVSQKLKRDSAIVYTDLVNAAIAGGVHGRETRAPIVTFI